MKFFGVQMEEGSDISNLTVDSGTSFPDQPNTGELFFRTDDDIKIRGLYIHILDDWRRISTTINATIPAGASLPLTGTIGDLFYKTSADNTIGTYVFNGTAWVTVAEALHTWSTITNTPTTLAGYGISDARPAFTGDVTKAANANVLTFSPNPVFTGTGALTLPSGTSGQRPADTAGTLRFNSQTGSTETFSGGAWQALTLDNDLRLKTKNVLHVQMNPGPGQFGSVKAAIESITDATTTNRYVVRVAAGKYIEDPIQMKRYVSVMGDSVVSTIIAANNPNADLITGVNDAELSHVTLDNATGTDKSAVRFSDAVENEGTRGFYISDLRFGNNSRLVTCTSTGKSTTVIAFNIQIGGSRSYDRAFVVESTNGGTARVVMRASTTRGATAPLPTEFAYASGTGAELFFNGLNTRISLSMPNGTGIRIRDGGTARLIGTTLRGYTRAIWVENVGDPPTLIGADVTMESNIQDLFIEHPGTKGSFIGTAEASKTSNVSNLSVLSLDPAAGSVNIVGRFNLGATQTGLVNVTDLITQTPAMGLLSGGALSGAGGLNVSIGAGAGYVRKNGIVTRINWEGATIAIAPDTTPYVYVTENAIPAQSSTIPNTTTNILLGRVGASGSSIYSLGALSVNITNHGNRVETWLREAVGPAYISGSIVTENPSTPRAIDVTAGQWYYGTLQRNPSAKTAPTIIDGYKSGGSVVTVPVPVIPNSTYDNGTNLVPVSPGYFTKHLLFQTSEGPYQSYILAHGQEQFATLQEARDGPQPVPRITPDATPRIAGFIMQEGVDAIVEIQDLRPLLMRAIAGVSATAITNHGDLTGLESDDHEQYALSSGERPFTGNVDLGNFQLLNVQSMNGINIGSHGSRHLPSGADPLTTAIASTLTGTSTNTIGVANSLARSDHTHAINITTTNVAEGTNLYWTTARFNTAIGTRTTSDLPEGTNLYFTTARASAASPVQSVAGRTGAVALTKTDVGLGNVANSLQVINGGNVPLISANATAQRPPAGTPGAIFLAVDTGTVFQDSGTTWNALRPAYTGDVFSTVGSSVLSLSTVNANIGTFNSITVNEKGLVTSAANVVYENELITLSGDVSGSGTNAISVTLKNTGISPGTYRSLTINSKGLVTAGTNPTTLAGYGITDAVNITSLAVASGVATLGNDGKLLSSQVPASLTGAVYKGTWNATTNQPSIVSGVGSRGDFYIVSTAGTSNIDGNNTWLVGDQIIFSGTVWQRIASSSSTVTSVAGKTGAVNLVAADVTGVAVDTTVVHLAGAETITGAKTFSSTIIGNLQGNITGNAATVTTNANLTGDVTSTGNATTLANAGTAGTYKSVTTDAKGRVISGTNPTTLAGYGITDANPAFTGDITKPLNSTVTTLASIGVPGTYSLVTTDNKGRVTSGSKPTTLSGYGITDAVNISLVGAPNGVASLDSSGKVPSSQLPASGASVYKGTWNASTNSPNLVSGVGVTGNYYNVSVAGSTNLDGVTTWNLGDQAIFNGSAWQRIQSSPNSVTSVAGRTGAVVISAADIADLPVMRTFYGTPGQINVTNGVPGNGDPVFSLVPNTIMPGTGQLTLPNGTTAQRPDVSTSNPGAIRFNTSVLNFEVFTNQWTTIETALSAASKFQPLNAALTALVSGANGLTARTAAGTWAARTLIAPASGFSITNPAGITGNPTFTLIDDLNAVENLNSTGITARTAANTWVTRAITGSSTITVTNGDGVSDNPSISIPENVVLPGTASLGIPAGNTSQRPVGPRNGSVRYNNDTDRFEFYQGDQWTTALNTVAPGVIPSQMVQLLTGDVPALSSTATTPFDNNIPSINNGTVLFSRTITTSSSSSRVTIAFPYWLDLSTNSGTVITQIFRSPFWAYQVVNVGGNKTAASATGYVGATTYRATITIDGVATSVAILGSNATTYGALIAGIKNALGARGNVELAGGNIKILSASSTSSSTISIVNGTPAMFSASLSGYTSISAAVPGSVAGCLVSLPTSVFKGGGSSAITTVDVPGSVGTYTYTVKSGVNLASTFYINSSALGNNFGGFNTTSYSILEVV